MELILTGRRFDALEAEVPSLLLQPLVENAIRHGVGRAAGGGEVRITGGVKGGRLHLEVRDSGPGFTATAGRGGGSGIGLENTRARLEELLAHRVDDAPQARSERRPAPSRRAAPHCS